jgi:hypothetical protein
MRSPLRQESATVVSATDIGVGAYISPPSENILGPGGTAPAPGALVAIDAAARLIQRAWRNYSDRLIFSFYLQLLAFDPADPDHTPLRLLAHVDPREAARIDGRMGGSVRFKLAGAAFPPLVVYKVYVNEGTVVDLGFFAPRAYERERQARALAGEAEADTHQRLMNPVHAAKFAQARTERRALSRAVSVSNASRPDAATGQRAMPDASSSTSSIRSGTAAQPVVAAGAVIPAADVSTRVAAGWYVRLTHNHWRPVGMAMLKEYSAAAHEREAAIERTRLLAKHARTAGDAARKQRRDRNEKLWATYFGPLTAKVITGTDLAQSPITQSHTRSASLAPPDVSPYELPAIPSLRTTTTPSLRPPRRHPSLADGATVAGLPALSGSLAPDASGEPNSKPCPTARGGFPGIPAPDSITMDHAVFEESVRFISYGLYSATFDAGQLHASPTGSYGDGAKLIGGGFDEPGSDLDPFAALEEHETFIQTLHGQLSF